MPDATHTPGPWAVNYNRIVINEDTGVMIASVLNVTPGAEEIDIEANRNADLISAAPEMLEALRYIVGWSPADWSPEEARDLANAAIAKATGTKGA